MTNTQDLLGWASMTAVVNELKTPSRFLRDKLFSVDDPRPTENLEIGVLIGDRVVAPFVRRGGEAVEVTGFQEKIYNVGAPNIRIKRHLEASELMFNRRVGHVIFADEGMILNAAQQHIARNSLRLVQMVDEAEEYLCAQALRGSISYEVDGEEAFSVTFPRTSSHTISSLTKFWDEADSVPRADFRTAMQLVNDDTGLNVTDVILGAEATDAFLDNAQVASILDNRRMQSGQLDLTGKIQQNGALFLGVWQGINVWSYTRATQVPSEPGAGGLASYDLVRSKYAEFVVADPAAENVMLYGAIPDIDALEGRVFQGKRFSKSWKQPDPSVMWQLLHSRPCPVMRRPDSTVSMKVVSG